MEEKYENKPVRSYTSHAMTRKNPLTYLAALLAVASTGIVIARLFIDGEAARSGSGSAATAAILSAAYALAAICFAAALIKNGGERLYTTSKPVIYAALIEMIRVSVGFGHGAARSAALKTPWLGLAAIIACCLALAVLYRLALNTGGVSRIRTAPRRAAALIGFFAAAAALLFLDKWLTGLDGKKALSVDAARLLALLAALTVLVGMKKTVSDRPLPMAGDRKDGRRLRSLDPLNGVAVYVMPDRNEANNLFRDSFECTKAEAYIREKREAGLEHFGYTHIFLAAYARTIAKLPALNRFISGQRIYSRGDDIEIAMTIKKDMSTEGSETIITIHLSPEDTAETVYEKFDREVGAAKGTEELDSSFDKTAGLFNMIPGLLMKFTVYLLKVADYFGKLPKLITKLSPFHGSMFITSMGSLGIPPVFHHLYDFGNIPVFIAFGMKRRENELQPDGTVVQKKYIDFTVNTDERICDGFYFAATLKYFRRMLADPQRLDAPPEVVNRDIE